MNQEDHVILYIVTVLPITNCNELTALQKVAEVYYFKYQTFADMCIEKNFQAEVQFFFFFYFFTVLRGKRVLNFNKVKFINFSGFYGGGERPPNSSPRGQEHFAVFFPTLWILVPVGKCLVNLEFILISNIR